MENCASLVPDWQPRPLEAMYVRTPERMGGHPPLAIAERQQWVALLRAFDRGEYTSKTRDLVPSLDAVLDRVRCRPGAALDAGCGSGLLGRSLLRRGWDVAGVDILPEAVQMAGPSFPTFLGDVLDLPFPSRSFDLVLCSMVLMLVEDDASAVAELTRVLRPGGILLLAVLHPAASGAPAAVPPEGEGRSGLAEWAFELPQGPQVVHYYRRSLEHYLGLVSGVDRLPTIFCVSPGGGLAESASAQPGCPAPEYVWLVGKDPCRSPSVGRSRRSRWSLPW